MRKLRAPRRGWAKITLGVSLLFAVGMFIYLTLAGLPVLGALFGVFIIAAGVWEYRRKLQSQITAERYEASLEQRDR